RPLTSSCPMDSGTGTRALPRVGFPIRTSRDRRLVSTSSGLFAATHVLHRLLAPRHPPCALHLLIVKNTVFCRYGVFKVRCGPTPAREQPAQEPVSQNSTAWNVEVDVRSRRARDRTAEAIDEPSACRSKCSGIPRKEVIQPQLPLRLPCYDFTPVPDPPFDGSLPYGLGHRLRVLPASVV